MAAVWHDPRATRNLAAHSAGHPGRALTGVRSMGWPSTVTDAGSSTSCSSSGVATLPRSKRTCRRLGLRSSYDAHVVSAVRENGPASCTCARRAGRGCVNQQLLGLALR